MNPYTAMRYLEPIPEASRDGSKSHIAMLNLLSY
jgi:hypothetical protein